MKFRSREHSFEVACGVESYCCDGMSAGVQIFILRNHLQVLRSFMVRAAWEHWDNRIRSRSLSRPVSSTNSAAGCRYLTDRLLRTGVKEDIPPTALQSTCPENLKRILFLRLPLRGNKFLSISTFLQVYKRRWSIVLFVIFLILSSHVRHLLQERSLTSPF